jgi:hypothetical protein
MCDINTPQFDSVRGFMRRHRNKNAPWQNHPLTVTDEWLAKKIEDDAWPQLLTLTVWNSIKDSEIQNEARREEYKRLREAEVNEATLGLNEDAEVTVPESPQSCWQRFKDHLRGGGSLDESDILSLENNVLETMRRLRRDTTDTGPVKGLVIGHVQSGKTTNMAALMNMAADWGINMFIVLTGRIESLRKQTHSRLSSDLCPGNLIWFPLGKQPNPETEDLKPQNLSFNNPNSPRYFTVVLKNPTRLKNLRDWLKSYQPALSNMKILIIDDESDEAGINTGDIDDEARRTAVNGFILEIAYLPAKAVNYVGYTATPYSNVLNEGPGRTLYPSSFIRSLGTTNKYFGPREIFGIEGSANAKGEASADGLGIIRSISDAHFSSVEDDINETVDETALIADIHSGDLSVIWNAKNLKNSIAWFLCAAATRRLWSEKDSTHRHPVTMLVHTSQKQEHHQNLADAIRDWLVGTPKEDIIHLCEEVWTRETVEFSLKNLREQYPDYRLMDEVKDYPAFIEIYPCIQDLLSEITPIPIDDASNQPAFHRGIHLCIDNCAHNGLTDEGQHVRLLYPNPRSTNPPPPDYTTAFIVVGGATLSRGLTLQGLLSTYFLRGSSLGDSLLQMGRWFGYRTGYELLPRIWMTEDTKDKFRWLSGVEQSLRDELKRYEAAGASPAKFGPRVKTHPLVSWLRITARNKMQDAENVQWDFEGITNQTTMFKNEPAWLKHNIETADRFLESLPMSPLKNRGGFVYRQVSFDQITEFLKGMNFHPRNVVFKEIDAFVNWYNNVVEKSGYTAWNVISAGFNESFETLPFGATEANWWRVPGGYVQKINRTRLGNIQNDQSFSIGALLSPVDRLGDYEGEIAPGTPSLDYVSAKRREAGLSLTPLLILYRVQKDSKYEGKNTKSRHDLNAFCDLLGVAMIIPGEQTPGGLVREVTVRIDQSDVDHPDIENTV